MNEHSAFNLDLSRSTPTDTNAHLRHIVSSDSTIVSHQHQHHHPQGLEREAEGIKSRAMSTKSTNFAGSKNSNEHSPLVVAHEPLATSTPKSTPNPNPKSESSPQLGQHHATPQSSSFPGATRPLRRSKNRGRKRLRKSKTELTLSRRTLTPPSMAPSLPSMSLFRQNLSRSNSSFLNSYLSQHEATRTCANATFTFIQRSDTEGLKAAVTKIQSLVKEQREAEKELRSQQSPPSSSASDSDGSCCSSSSQQRQKKQQKLDDKKVVNKTETTSTVAQIVPFEQTENSHQNRPLLVGLEKGSGATSGSDYSTNGSDDDNEDSYQTHYETRASLICQHLVRLHSYVQDEFYRIVLGGCGAIQVTLEAMNAFSGHEYVQAAGNLTIGGLCDSNLMNSLKLVKSGGLVTIINSVQKFPKSSNVCSMAVNCLVLATAVTELAVLFLKQMKDGVKSLEDIPDSLLSYEAPKNKDIVLERIKLASLSGKTSPITGSTSGTATVAPLSIASVPPNPGSGAASATTVPRICTLES